MQLFTSQKLGEKKTRCTVREELSVAGFSLSLRSEALFGFRFKGHCSLSLCNFPCRQMSRLCFWSRMRLPRDLSLLKPRLRNTYRGTKSRRKWTPNIGLNTVSKFAFSFDIKNWPQSGVELNKVFECARGVGLHILWKFTFSGCNLELLYSIQWRKLPLSNPKLAINMTGETVIQETNVTHKLRIPNANAVYTEAHDQTTWGSGLCAKLCLWQKNHSRLCFSTVDNQNHNALFICFLMTVDIWCRAFGNSKSWRKKVGTKIFFLFQKLRTKTCRKLVRLWRW